MESNIYSDYIVFVDESGDHILKAVDSSFPLFILDFCIFQKDQYVKKIVPKIQAFKFEHFGHDTVVLHEHDIRKQKSHFSFLKDKDKREIFMEKLNKLIEEAEFTILPTVIKKIDLKEKYSNPHNPYELALTFCMERMHFFLKQKKQLDKVTYIVVEKRGQKEDKELELTFRRFCDGNNYGGIKMNNFEVIFADKKINSVGLQLADLTARPIGQYIRNPNQKNRAWEIIQKKLNKKIIKGGIKTFP